VKIKTSELTGKPLDWAVATCEGNGVEFDDPTEPWLTVHGIALQPLDRYTPSANWAAGGPIIERNRIELIPNGDGWGAFADRDEHIPHEGPTPLVAAMRCYVASKLGDKVDVPEELV